MTTPPAIDDLVSRLRSLARAEHDDLSIGDEAALAIKVLYERLLVVQKINAQLIDDNEALRTRAEAKP